MFSKVVCVIVDAYSTGKNLAPILKGRGYPCIHIKSSSDLPSRYKHNENDFILSLSYDDNLDYIVSILKSFTIKCCLPGYESGVKLADMLCEKLNLLGNSTEGSEARRNKYLMNEAVAAAGIRTVRHFTSNCLLALLEWARENQQYPIVAKPLDSANGDGVFFCHNEEQIKDAYTKITSAKNQFGIQNDHILLENLNIGKEYIINTVSWEGHHFIAEIWKVTREPFTTIYDKAEIVSFEEEIWSSLAEYTYGVLNALGIRFGAGTTEVKYTKETGATLLETSARLMGNAPLGFSQELAGFSQLSLLIEAYLNPEDFMYRLEHQRTSSKYNGMAVVLKSDVEGTIKKSFKESFHNLKTLHSYLIADEPDSKLEKTVNSLTAPGEIYLIGTEEDLLKDHQIIREMEKTLYVKAVEYTLNYPPHGIFDSSQPETLSEEKKTITLNKEFTQSLG